MAMAKTQTKPKTADLISTTETAKRLGVTSNMVRTLVADGHLIGYRIGRVVRIDSDSIESFLAKNRMGGHQ
ncbi:hypothetical protein MMAGJ_02230 [Mycolicibacterium mageritense]|uniref:Helix-turn-helix domain-containing protein n=2 Tax=Mycolicibacterium mageritense TaxID=53462 RepID=A0ABM7HKC6_MYCME|nr:hypothetical protein MMAGJ_02230 [Mycolicibacterium mageritense]